MGVRKKRFILLEHLQCGEKSELYKQLGFVYAWGFINIYMGDIKQIVAYILLAINIGWAFVSPRMYPNALTKELFLCPITKAQQRKYLLNNIRHRTLRDYLLCLVSIGIAVVIGGIHLSGAIAVFVSYVLCHLSNQFYIDVSDISPSIREKVYGLKGYSVKRVCLNVFSMIVWVIVFYYANGPISGDQLLISILLGIQLIAVVIFIRRYGKNLIECGIDSELMCFRESTPKKGATA